MTAKSNRVLVIRLGALGDMVLCFQSFYEIRAAHPDAEIALLTMPAFADFARVMPWFDKIILDERAPMSRPDGWLRLWQEVKAFSPNRVYDLQGKRRQNILYGLLGGPFGPDWSGSAPFCSHPRLWPPLPDMHFTDFVAAQLRRAQVPPQKSADLSWLDASLETFELPLRIALLVPGCAPGREYKRWPPEKFAAIARHLDDQGITSLALGTYQDMPAIRALRGLAPHVRDLCGQTSLLQLAALARKAFCVIGNDSGPTHLAAAVGAPTLALISDQVNPVWSAPRGPRSAWLEGQPLDALGIDKVLLALTALLDKNGLHL